MVFVKNIHPQKGALSESTNQSKMDMTEFMWLYPF